MSDGTTFASKGGVDGLGNAYSTNLLGSTHTVGGVHYTLNPPDRPNILRGFGQTIAFPNAAGKGTLNLLATGVNGSQLDQRLLLNFTDGTSSMVKQSFSDWKTPSNFSGEVTSIPLSYYDTSTGGRVQVKNYVYSYSFRIPQGKTLASLTLPSNRNSVILGIEVN